MAIVRGGSPGERSETRDGRFCEKVGLKPGVKKEGVMDVQSGESEEEELMGEGIGE